MSSNVSYLVTECTSSVAKQLILRLFGYLEPFIETGEVTGEYLISKPNLCKLLMLFSYGQKPKNDVNTLDFVMPYLRSILVYTAKDGFKRTKIRYVVDEPFIYSLFVLMLRHDLYLQRKTNETNEKTLLTEIRS